MAKTKQLASDSAPIERLATVDARARTHIAIKPTKKIERFLITGAVRGAPVDNAFLDNLERYSKYVKAEIIVVPMKSAYSISEVELAPRLSKFRVVEELRLIANLNISEFQINPQQIDPTTGIDRFIQSDASALIASPKQRMRCVANSNTQLPKILQGTGVCTQARYRDNRQGHIARNDHTIGAIYVETNGVVFNFRQLSATYDGSFIDLGNRVGKTITAERAEALVLGDWHTGSVDPKVRVATYELIKQLRPRKLILHDLFDGRSVNHHEAKKLLTQARVYKDTDLQEEIAECGNELALFLKHAPKDTEIVVVKSNHDEFLPRFLETGEYLKNFRNSRYMNRLAGYLMDGIDPLRQAIEDYNGGAYPRVTWLNRDEDFKVRGWQLGSHGDLGSNGSKGSLKTTQRTTGRSITGHTHTPEIINETISVGTSTTLKVGYNRGPSSWMQSHAALYANQRAQLINVIDGAYQI